ncbi:hypothetical protein WJX84_005627 [Apatococcus fuscideae]|uniref:Uncharacterized protein n=1 Tax=Apatococcus fuscideae TaxID=2026836 RepID=A0AAW1TH86_9CHLO
MRRFGRTKPGCLRTHPGSDREARRGTPTRLQAMGSSPHSISQAHPQQPPLIGAAVEDSLDAFIRSDLLEPFKAPAGPTQTRTALHVDEGTLPRECAGRAAHGRGVPSGHALVASQSKTPLIVPLHSRLPKRKSRAGRPFKSGGGDVASAPVTKHEDQLKKRQIGIGGSSGRIGPQIIENQAEQAASSSGELLQLRHQMASLHWQCKHWKLLAIQLELGHTSNLIQCMELAEALGLLPSEPSSDQHRQEMQRSACSC